MLPLVDAQHESRRDRLMRILNGEPRRALAATMGNSSVTDAAYRMATAMAKHVDPQPAGRTVA
jgi:hypothetical protein